MAILDPHSKPRDNRIDPAQLRRGQEGSALLIAMLILGALTVLGTGLIVSSMGDRNLSRYDRHSLIALSAAETGVAFAERSIVNLDAPLEDYDSDGRPDFELEDSLSTGATYRVIAEASDIRGPGITAFGSNGFTILSEGRYLGAVRRVKVEIVHDSFLKFARFVSQHGLQFECGDLVAGEVYAGGSITLSCGCSASMRPRFLEEVRAAGPIPQPQCGIFERGYVARAEPIDLFNSLDWTEIRNKARGLGSVNSCGGQGSVGIYFNLPSIDPLGLALQAGADQNVLVFSNFDFANTTLQPPDTVITYRGTPVINTLTGERLKRGDFNGIIFFEGTIEIRGKLEGVSAFSTSVFTRGRGRVVNDIITGLDGFDPFTRLPNGSGKPVTASIVAEDYVAMAEQAPRILRIDAAIFSRTSNWRGLGGIGNHPVGGPGPLDLDLDGIWGETPRNHDPLPGQGWDELNITDKHWVLNTTGPIVTYTQGDANPWNAGPVLAQASGPTRRQTYDLKYQQFPPPCFPLPINQWRRLTWTEVFNVRNDLANHLPN